MSALSTRALEIASRIQISLSLSVVLSAAAVIGACARPSPLDLACADVASRAVAIPGAMVRQSTDSFPSFTGEEMRFGCLVTVAGPIDPTEPVPILVTTFADSLGGGWRRDDSLAADGPAQTIYGIWRDDVLCLVRVDWGKVERRGDAPREAGSTYAASIGCERLPERIVPRS